MYSGVFDLGEACSKLKILTTPFFHHQWRSLPIKWDICMNSLHLPCETTDSTVKEFAKGASKQQGNPSIISDSTAGLELFVNSIYDGLVFKPHQEVGWAWCPASCRVQLPPKQQKGKGNASNMSINF